MNHLRELTSLYLPAIESNLRQGVAVTRTPGLEELHHMLAYHMGWEGEGAGPDAQGKRIRPLLVLLCAEACQAGTWQSALPAAVAVELVHNFSLIHDDIEDNSPLRRGRPTLWTQWGIPQAINAGDALFTLAHLAALRLTETADTPIALRAAQIIQQTCLHLTQGQYLDIGYANRNNLQPADYWPMVAGKTAALLACCTELGALVAGSSQAGQYREFGRLLGLAFQAQDDLLGIWGDVLLTGKSAESDLVEGKKSLPVLYGISYQGQFAQRWASGPVTVGEVAELSALLEAEGARAATQADADRLTQDALQALDAANPQGEAGQALHELAHMLLKRQK
jgi:geranylgeranyl diphosphate synthase type I